MAETIRPTSIDEVKRRLAGFHSPGARAAVDTLDVKASDVFIATYSKSGTTWMQQVVHQLRSGGHVDYDEIMEVVPFLEVALDAGVDPRAPQRWSPRAFKSHLRRPELPKGGRYITVFRDPRTVVTSFYRFFEGWWFEPGTITLDDFAFGLYLGGTASGRHWDHFVDWWPHVEDLDVLALAYEDMLLAPDAVPGTVAEFLGIELDAATMETVVEHSSRAYMTAHARQFDEHLLRAHRDDAWGLPPGGDSSKATHGAELVRSAALEEALSRTWTDVVEPALGFPDYPSMRAALPNPLRVTR